MRISDWSSDVCSSDLLTPLECARLMGFDRGNRRWRIEVSDTQAYRQFGNAVVVPVVEFIARAMQPHIHRAIGIAAPEQEDIVITRQERVALAVNGLSRLHRRPQPDEGRPPEPQTQTGKTS